jgi:hypothetical protein
MRVQDNVLLTTAAAWGARRAIAFAPTREGLSIMAEAVRVERFA